MATAAVRCAACVLIAAAFILHGCGDNDEANTLVAAEGTNAAATPNNTTPSLRPRAPTQDIPNNKTEDITNAAATANNKTEDIPNEEIKESPLAVMQVTCRCDAHNQWNQYSCTDGTSGFCGEDSTCFATDPFIKGDWTQGCHELKVVARWKF